MALPASASVVSSGLVGYPTIFYDRIALATLEKSLFFYQACDLRVMPDRSGVVMQLITHSPFAANVSAATEGTPGAGQAITRLKGDLTLSNFVDGITISEKSIRTDILDAKKEAAKLLTYRGALTVDTVILNAVDTATGSNSASKIELADATFMTASTSRKASGYLQAANYDPKANGRYFGIIPAVLKFDLVNDATAGGFMDQMKYTEANAGKLQKGIEGQFVGLVDGVEWYMSNNVTTEADYKATGKTGYHAYVFANESVIAASLGNTKLGQKNFSVNVFDYNTPTPANLGGVIKAGCDYNFWFGVAVNPNGVAGWRRITAQSNIG